MKEKGKVRWRKENRRESRYKGETGSRSVLEVCDSRRLFHLVWLVTTSVTPIAVIPYLGRDLLLLLLLLLLLTASEVHNASLLFSSPLTSPILSFLRNLSHLYHVDFILC